MSQVLRTTGLGWLAMLACLSLLLVTIGASASHAQTTGSPTKAEGTLEGGADAGDPDMPTGDTPPSSGSGATSGTDGGTFRAHATTGGVTEAVPSTRWGQWAHWKVALKLFARSFILR